ncbi:MAG: DciA family protein [Wenzhouxiangella sp.]
MVQKDEKQPLDSVAGHAPLQRLLRAERAFEALDARIQPLLPDTARGHIRIACVDQSVLVIAAASSTWASRARLEAGRILEAAQALWPEELCSTKVIVSPGLGPDV